MRPTDLFHDSEVLRFVLVLVTYFKVLRQNLPGDTVKDHENLIEIGAAYHTSSGFLIKIISVFLTPLRLCASSSHLSFLELMAEECIL